MKLEKAAKEDAQEMAEWMIKNYPQNNASVESLKLCSYFKIAGILYLPVKPVLMLESLAPNPEVTGSKRLLGIRRALNDLRKLYPHTEFYFLTKGFSKLDEAANIYGFTEMPYRVFRMRPNDRNRTAKSTVPESAPEEAIQPHSGTVRGDQVAAEGSMPGLRQKSGRC
jgi:hypothetical protein